MYIGAAGDAMWGGAADTSYHDVLLAAGLRDAASEAGLTGWPALGVEQILTLDPMIVVGEPGTRDTLCHHAGLAGLHACTDGRVIELPARVLSDPGPTMVDAVAALEAAWHG
jgi:iron complex transport system substrate-binding protein